MNTATHEQDNIESWRKELDDYNRANSPLQRKLHIQRQMQDTKYKTTIETIISATLLAFGFVAFVYLVFGFNK